MNNIETENIIILKSVWGKVGQKYYINPCKDPKTGRYPDCIRRIDSNGDMILSDKDKNEGTVCIPEDKVFIIEDGTTFNLDDPWSKAEWDAIKNCKLIASSRDQRDSSGVLIIDGQDNKHTKNYDAAFRARNGIAELYVYKPGLESEKRVSKKRLKNQAISFVFEDSMEGLITKAKLLGRKMNNLPLADIQDYLVEEAERNPQKIINLYTGEDLHLRILLMDALEKGIITIKNKFYFYGDILISGSEDAALTWMRQPKNAKILELIKKDTHPEYYDIENPVAAELEEIKKTAAKSKIK